MNTKIITFIRLLAEISAVGLTGKQYKLLSISADLTKGDIDEILLEADEEFEKLKNKIQTNN